MSDLEEEGEEVVADWRRLDRRMLLVHPVQELVRFFPVVLGALFLGNSTGGGRPYELIGIALPVLVGLARYFTTTYRVTPVQVDLRRGLVGTKVVTARLDRVRAVELSATPIHRVLGLAKVEIGTASAVHQAEEAFALDALAVGAARELRTALLHRIALVPATASPDSGPGPGPTAQFSTPPASAPHDVLLSLDPAWVRYAPLTSAGNVIAAGLLAVVVQFGDQAGLDLAEGGRVEQWFVRAGVLVGVLSAVGAFLVAGAILSVLGYLVTHWGFSLSRDAAGRSFHTTRGLLTRTETSLDRERLRGVEVGRPLGLRLAGAARLNAIVTGLSAGERGSTLLAPPAPAAVVDRVGEDVLDVAEPTGSPDSPLRATLRPHGPAALRRRLVRALGGAALLPLGVAVLAATGPTPWGLLVPALLLLPLAGWLGLDRYRQLGHALTERHLVVSSGSIRGRRDVLTRAGIIGWNIEQSFFQRRAGLVTLVATTAAGKQEYAAYDLAEDEAIVLAEAATPGLLAPYLR